MFIGLVLVGRSVYLPTYLLTYLPTYLLGEYPPQKKNGKKQYSKLVYGWFRPKHMTENLGFALFGSDTEQLSQVNLTFDNLGNAIL